MRKYIDELSTTIEPINISQCNFTYIITPSPNPNNISYYKDLFSKQGVTTIVRLCEKIYDANEFAKIDINVIDIPLQDGQVPDDEMIKKWINIIKNEIKNKKNIIAVHCMSGLGRAPLFVGICMIVLNKVENMDAIAHLRKYIPYALNTKQLIFLCKFHTNDYYNKFCLIC
jgi:protein tyrosine phosphatase type 4A